MADITVGFDRVVLDTSSCIYYLEGPPNPRRDRLMPLFAAAEQGTMIIVLPTIVVVELLTGPLRAGDREAEASARLFVSHTPGVEVHDVTFAVACKAAELRAKYQLRTPDAVILATAVVGADGVIGNDAAWRRVTETRFLYLDEHQTM